MLIYSLQPGYILSSLHCNLHVQLLQSFSFKVAKNVTFT